MQFIRDTYLVFGRALRLSLRNPVWVIFGIMQPILYLTLFGPLLEPVASTPGFPEGDAWQVFVPGLLVLLGLFGAAFVGFGLIAEWRAGVVDRMRVTPASRSALLVGRMLRDVLVITVQGVLLIVVALLMGLEAGFGFILVSLGVIAILGGSLSAASYGLALKLKSEDAFAPVLNGVMLPLTLLSGILLPMSLAPGWLETASRFNPLTYVVDGVRSILRGELWTGDTGWGLAVTVVLVGLGILYGARMFRKESA